MRVNIYSQELILNGDPGTIELGTSGSNTGVEYPYVRMMLHSSSKLHHPPQDDDRSAVTFWLPKSQSKRWALKQLFLQMADLIDQAPVETGLD
jgi:hypothetical protein